MAQSLANRMKGYEKEHTLPINIPLILRIDGRAFHSFTKDMKKPFDEDLIEMMNTIGLALCDDIQNCRFAYIQSDEISFLIYNKIDSSPWFDNSIQKICSVSAALASSVATGWVMNNIGADTGPVSFDARVNIYPAKDVANYFIWRQQDWERNSVQMVARSHYGQKELHKKNRSEMQEMIFQKGDNWNDYPAYLKRGRCVIRARSKEYVVNEHFKGEVERNRWVIDNDIPIFQKDREFIENMLKDDFAREI